MISKISLLLCVFLAPILNAQTEKYIWFDLGNTLIDTRNGFDQIKFMPGAVEYLNHLKANGFKVGIISNVPDSWGRRGDLNSKIKHTEKLIKKGWKDPHYDFNFSDFDHVLMPVYESEAKPAPTLFRKALEVSKNAKVVFQGETPAEVEAARREGMHSHLVRSTSDGTVYLPIEEMPLQQPKVD